jgi:endoglucanase
VTAVLLSVALALQLYADPPHTHAAHQAKVYAAHGRAKDAKLMRALSKVPQAAWFTGGTPKATRRAVARLMGRAGRTVPVLVAYNVPNRDCGQYSAGGAKYYRRWIDAFADGIGSHRAIVIVEPDSLAAGCGAKHLRAAVDRLNRLPIAAVYVDAGHSNWQPAATMAKRLRAVHARAFSLNVSNFRRTAEVSRYGMEISQRLGNAHFVIDTSRNGRGPKGAQWCNPPKRGLGARPTTTTNNPVIDAYLWIKVPGESDGACGNAPPAGQWWPKYALGLARRAVPAL